MLGLGRGVLSLGCLGLGCGISGLRIFVRASTDKPVYVCAHEPCVPSAMGAPDRSVSWRLQM